MTVGVTSYRCRVGHAWTADALLLARDDEAVRALWIAVRSLREKAQLSRRQGDNVAPGALRRRYTELAHEADHAVHVLTSHLNANPPTVPADDQP